MHRWRDILTLSLVVSLVGTALAAQVHLTPDDPPFVDQGVTLLMTGTLDGLGHADLTVLVTASGTPSVLCTTLGGTEPPGQNPGMIESSGVTTIPAREIENGQVSLNLTTEPNDPPTAAAAGCSTDHGPVTITDIAFESVSVVVIQHGVVVLEEMYTL